MVRRVKIETFCTHCYRRQQEVEATPISLVINGVKFEVDLCDRCDETFLGPVREMSQKEVSKEDAPRAPRGPYKSHADEHLQLKCFLDKCGYRGVSVSAYTQHLTQRHKTRITSEFDSCPLCGEKLGEGTLLGSHGQKDHNIATGAEVINEAVAQGDPKGVLAEVNRRHRERSESRVAS